MLDVALKLLKELTSHSYKAYIVGGFVRDHLLGIESSDIDICTNATPKEIKEIFESSCLPNEDYGSVTVILKGVRFEITTFRKEVGYVNNRKPMEIKYIDDLYQDLLRRDFYINTLCMDENGEVLDFLGGMDDINKRIIRSIGNPKDRFEEDCLRILRAIRFATILDFKLDDDIIKAIEEKKDLLKNLSYYRKKSELEKIFTSSNCKKGIQLLLDLGLDKLLEIPNLYKVLEYNTLSLLGIWSILDVLDKYPFTKSEVDLIQQIDSVMKLDNLDPFVLYQYGLYVNSVCFELKNGDIKEVTEAYQKLPIKSRREIAIDVDTICQITNIPAGEYLKILFDDLEKKILSGKLVNNLEDISQYIKKKYHK